jgi:hypothetical protein
LPSMQEAYRCEVDPDVRSTLVRSIWEHRQQSTIPFLGEALHDPDPEVWKAALDGLVALASSEASRVLRVSTESIADERSSWIQEAIEQVDDAISQQPV